MTDRVHPPIEDEALDDPTPVGPMRVARIWRTKRPPFEGSLATSLKAMDVLYDAGEPLTREELESRLIPRLDPYERGYLQDWHIRQQEYHRAYHLRHRKSLRKSPTRSVQEGELQLSCTERAVHAWVTTVFLTRARVGRTLERMADGKLRPGPGTPRMARADGRLVPYTSETRHQLAEEDRIAHRQYLADVEWVELFKTLPVAGVAARAQVLTLLMRRLFFGVKTGGDPKPPFDERGLTHKLNRLISLADTPAVQKAVLQHAFNALLTELEPSTAVSTSHDKA
jgi:hypothetical protein